MANPHRVTLTDDGPLTHTGRGRKFERGQSVILSDDADILYYKGVRGFDVRALAGSKSPKAGAKAGAKSAAPEDAPASSEELTREGLDKLTKSALLQLVADEGLDAKVDQSMRKADMIDAILESVSEDGPLEPSDEDEDEDETEADEAADEED